MSERPRAAGGGTRDLPELRDFIRGRRAALYGFMEQGVALELDGSVLRVLPSNDVYVRYLDANRALIAELATEFYSRPIEVQCGPSGAALSNGNGKRLAPRAATNGRGSTLPYAIAYARRGIGVFPVHDIESDRQCSCGKLECPSGGKHPRLKDWQTLATTNESQLSQWWREWPHANVGVKCGADSNLTVLDVDGEEGRGTLRALELERGELPETPIAITGSGGAHYYFAFEDGLQNAVRFAPGLDIRTEGGLVVGVGSRTKQPYAWETAFALGDDLKPARMPEWLVDLIRTANVPTATGQRATVPANIHELAEGSGRNNVIYKLGRSLKAQGFLPDAIEAALTKTNQGFKQPFPAQELAVQIAHIIDQPDRAGFGPPTQNSNGALPLVALPDRPLLLNFADSRRLAEEAESRPHVIQDFVTTEDIFGVAGKKGFGKSTFLRWMAVAVSEGWDFLGLKTNQTRVWYIDLEPGNHQKRHEKFERLGWNERSQNLIVTASPPVAGQPWAFEWLEEEIEKNGFGLVIIDTLFKFCKIEQGNDYSSGLYGSAPLEGVVKRTKAAIGAAHHSQKNGNPNNPNVSAADLFLGAVSIAGSFGVCLAIRRTRGGPGGSRTSLFMDPPRYTRQVIEGEWLIAEDPMTGRVELGESLKQDWWKRAQEDVMGVARRLNKPFTVTNVLERVDGYKRAELKRILNYLVDDRKLNDLGKENKRGGAVQYELRKVENPQPEDRRQRDKRLTDQHREFERLIVNRKVLDFKGVD